MIAGVTVIDVRRVPSGITVIDVRRVPSRDCRSYSNKCEESAFT